jgi:hypothetical protein
MPEHEAGTACDHEAHARDHGERREQAAAQAPFRHFETRFETANAETDRHRNSPTPVILYFRRAVSLARVKKSQVAQLLG